MIEQFLEVIESKALFNNAHRLLVAVSGGVDSMTLCHLLKLGKFKFSVAHCNFKLRGNDSDLDEALVMNWCAGSSIKFYSKSFDTKSYAIDHRVSIQMAARELRYAWFDELMESHGYDYLLTAHHLDDSLETVLFNLAKGTGLRGVTGIMEKGVKGIRPLLNFSRAQILHYANQSHLKWREDVSNTDLKYHRNRIRRHVIPELEKINPSLLETYKNTQTRLIAIQNYLDEALSEKLDGLVQFKNDDVFIDTRPIHSVVEYDYLLKSYGFNYFQLLAIQKACLSGDSGKLFYSSTHQLNVDRKQIVISPVTESFSELKIESNDTVIRNEHLSMEVSVLSSGESVNLSDREAWIDLGKLKFPLKLRKWRNGDFFYPLGMQGKKKVSDYMIDNKIPLNLKSRVGVLECAGEIVWVVGHRLDDRFKITDQTKKIYRVKLI